MKHQSIQKDHQPVAISNKPNYLPIIGLEIHVELKTKSKMFCQCSADYFGKQPNTHVCPVCLGLPGALPVPNRTAVLWTMKLALALGCTIPTNSKFDRKHYFYPDLPKGYQISQYDEPIGVKGEIAYNAGEKIGRIHRVHLEEDTGKLSHTGNQTGIDFNRSSVPLVEIVTEPDFHNSTDVKNFLQELHTIIRYLDISDADMEEGSMRMEPNISLLKLTDGVQNRIKNNNGLVDPKDYPKYKVEVKNINSFQYAKEAIDYELPRQEQILEAGETPVQETRGYNEKKKITVSQRSKEEARDYRYFPEPDIPPMQFPKELQIEVRNSIPELPLQKYERYTKELKIKPADAAILIKDHPTSQYFDELCKKAGQDLTPQDIANLVVNKKLETSLSHAEFIKQAKAKMQPVETDTEFLVKTVESVLAANEKAVSDYKSGKENALMFLLGHVMRGMKGKADPATVKEALLKAFKKL